MSQPIKKPVAKNLPTIGRPSSSTQSPASSSSSSFVNNSNNNNRSSNTNSSTPKSRIPPQPPKPSSFQINNANRTTSAAGSNSASSSSSRLPTNNNNNNNNNNNSNSNSSNSTIKGKNTMIISSDLFQSPVSKSIRTLEAYRQFISNFERPPAELFASNSEELDAWKELNKQNSSKSKAAIELAYRVISQEVGDAIGDIIEAKFQLRDELPSTSTSTTSATTTSTVSVTDFNQFKLEFEKMKKELKEEKLARKKESLIRQDERNTYTERFSEINGTIVQFADGINLRLKAKFTDSKATIVALQERILILESTIKSQSTPLPPSISTPSTPPLLESAVVSSTLMTVDKLSTLPEHLSEINLSKKFTSIEESQEMLKFGLKSVAQTLGVKLFNNKKRKIDEVEVGNDEVAPAAADGEEKDKVELEGLVQKIAKLDSSVKNFVQISKTSIESSEGLEERTVKLEESMSVVQTELKEVKEKKNSAVVVPAVGEDVEMGEAGDDDKTKNVAVEALEGRLETLETTLATLESSFSSYFSDPTSSTHPQQLLALIESTSESLATLTSQPSTSLLQTMLFNAFNVQSEKLTEKDLPILLQKFISRFSDLEALTIKLDEDLIGNKEKVKGTVESMDILKNKIKVFMKDIAKSMNYLQSEAYENNRVNKTFTALQDKGLIPTDDTPEVGAGAVQEERNHIVEPDL